LIFYFLKKTTNSVNRKNKTYEMKSVNKKNGRGGREGRGGRKGGRTGGCVQDFRLETCGAIDEGPSKGTNVRSRRRHLIYRYFHGDFYSTRLSRSLATFNFPQASGPAGFYMNKGGGRSGVPPPSFWSFWGFWKAAPFEIPSSSEGRWGE